MPVAKRHGRGGAPAAAFEPEKPVIGGGVEAFHRGGVDAEQSCCFKEEAHRDVGLALGPRQGLFGRQAFH